MRSPARTPFAAIFQNEVLLNSKRVAPYALMIFFSSNAVLWTVSGAAVHYGWATNSDFYIARNFGGFAFGILGLPLFAALIMADPVIRDYRLRVDPLIFSKPVSRAAYLLGKFFGNFFVLVCCQAAFALTMLILQVFHTSRMVVLPFRVFPYFKHFFFLVVVSYLLFAAVYFAVGTLTRNAKIVYGLAVSYYPLYIAWQLVVLKNLPLGWRVALDPLLMNSPKEQPWGRDPEWVNQIAVNYTSGMIANRALVILAAAACLTILYMRFAIAERPVKVEKLSLLNLSAGAGGFYYDPPNIAPTFADPYERPDTHERVLLPEVARASEGLRANLNKLFAALNVEFRLLLSERSLVVIIPLAIVLSTLDVAFWSVTPEPSLSAAYAGHTAKSLLLFLLGITIFYTGEAMHRDRDLGIEPLLWSQPGPNYVLLLSKCLATLVLTLSLILLVGVITITLQILKHNGPIELQAYLRIYSLILVPNAIFMTAAVLMLNVLLRDRYLTYATAIGICSGLFYLYTQGHNHWLYNPVLLALWDYPDLIGGANHSRILWHRIYILTLAALFIGLAHLCYPREYRTKSRVR